MGDSSSEDSKSWPDVTDETIGQLITAAKDVRENAHSVVHNFPIGAAVLTREGDIYTGCNVESIIAGLGSCAERCAINAAVAGGAHEFAAIVIYAETSEPIAPCGMCRQYLYEFAERQGHDIAVILAGSERIETSISELLPMGFGTAELTSVE